MKIYIIEDDDTGECHVFKHRKNAIDTMYRKCKEWGAVLYAAVKVNGFYQYTELGKIYDTDEQKLDFLYHSSATELCDIFETYWYFQECEIEDEEG